MSFGLLFRQTNLDPALMPSPPTAQIRVFMQHLRRIYHIQNSYHNFAHALDVLQAMHYFLCAAGIVPSASILLERAE